MVTYEAEGVGNPSYIVKEQVATKSRYAYNARF